MAKATRRSPKRAAKKAPARKAAAKSVRKTVAKTVRKVAAKAKRTVASAKRKVAAMAKRKPAAKAARAPARKAMRPGARKTKRAAPGRHVPTPNLHGWITHTDITSADPAATKAWCQSVLGWKFMGSMPTPGGEYHLFAYSDKGGGGLQQTSGGQPPASTPFVHVDNAQAAFDKAVAAGAEIIESPRKVMEGVTTAVVRAPGGVVIGFAGP